MKISRDSDVVELNGPPHFEFGEKVKSRRNIRNDGTFPGREVGDILVRKGDEGYVVSIGTFLQQFYIYAVEFPASGHQVGMRGKELCTLDHLPDEVLARLGERAAQLETLR